MILGASIPCILRSEAHGRVCVCNATYCDTFEESLIPSTPDEVIVVSTGPVSDVKFNLCLI